MGIFFLSLSLSLSGCIEINKILDSEEYANGATISLNGHRENMAHNKEMEGINRNNAKIVRA
jgi:starvation-inducible outer membrane lipoprotein